MEDSVSCSVGIDDTTQAPLVSVIVPAYNAEKYVLEAIRSINDQNYKPIEILLIDDGSTDGTVELVKQEAPHVRIIQQANAGASAARNTGLSQARGELIAFLDADDGWYPGKLLAQVDYLQQHPEVGVVFHEWLIWTPDENGRYVEPKRLSARDPEQTDGHVASQFRLSRGTRFEIPVPGEIDPATSGWIYTLLLLQPIAHTSTVMMRSEVVREIGFFDTSLIAGEDYDYWLRVSRKFQIHNLTGIYSFYRGVAGSLSNTPKADNFEYRVIRGAVDKWGLTSPDGTTLPRRTIDKRLGQIAFGFGYGHYHRGSIALARDAFRTALKHEPLSFRTIAYLLAATLKTWV